MLISSSSDADEDFYENNKMIIKPGDFLIGTFEGGKKKIYMESSFEFTLFVYRFLFI